METFKCRDVKRFLYLISRNLPFNIQVAPHSENSIVDFTALDAARASEGMDGHGDTVRLIVLAQQGFSPDREAL